MPVDIIRNNCPIFLEPEQSQQNTVLSELREIKNMLKDIKNKQGEMEKALVKVNKQLADKNFDLAKSSHAVSIFYVLFKLSISLIFTKLFFPPDCF